jgi:hypothetical protein
MISADSHPTPGPIGAPPTGPRMVTGLAGTRPPTDAERDAAARFGRALRSAARRDQAPVALTATVPPRRVRMAGALAAAGPRPPLRIGIACDVSASMHTHAAAAASAGWVTAQAAARLPNTRTSIVIFGETVVGIVTPGPPPTAVTDFASLDDDEYFTGALHKLDDHLDLTHPAAARLLVVISDGEFSIRGERFAGQDRLNRLRASGCALLWLVPDTATATATPAHGAHIVIIRDADDAVRAIRTAACRVLTTA